MLQGSRSRGAGRGAGPDTAHGKVRSASRRRVARATGDDLTGPPTLSPVARGAGPRGRRDPRPQGVKGDDGGDGGIGERDVAQARSAGAHVPRAAARFDPWLVRPAGWPLPRAPDRQRSVCPRSPNVRQLGGGGRGGRCRLSRRDRLGASALPRNPPPSRPDRRRKRVNVMHCRNLHSGNTRAIRPQTPTPRVRTSFPHAAPAS